MSLILLEALGALAIAAFIVWWTMFHGRSKPGPSSDADADAGAGGKAQATTIQSNDQADRSG